MNQTLNNYLDSLSKNTMAHKYMNRQKVKVTYDTGNFGTVHKFTGTKQQWLELKETHRLKELTLEIVK